MASTASTVLRMELMANGENDATWGSKTNTNLNILESAVSGTQSIATTGGSTTLTNSDYTNDQAKKSTLDVTGALVSNATIVIPNASRTYRVFNRTSGSFTLTIKTSSGTGIEVPQSTVATVYCDGSNTVRFATPISDYTTGAPATSSGASAATVSVVPTGNLSSSNAQAALVELQQSIDTVNTLLTSSYQPLAAGLTDIAALARTKGNMIVATGSAWSVLAVGTNGYVPVAKSGASTGVAWSALIPETTLVLMYESSVVGWTINTSHTNYAVRIVSSGAGTAVAGTGFTSVFTDRTITQANLPSYTLPDTFAISSAGSHSHSISIRTQEFSASGFGTTGLVHPSAGASSGTTTETTDTEAAHTHTLTGSVTSGGSGTAMDFGVSYINVGKFSKNAY